MILSSSGERVGRKVLEDPYNQEHLGRVLMARPFFIRQKIRAGSPHKDPTLASRVDRLLGKSNPGQDTLGSIVTMPYYPQDYPTHLGVML